MEDFSFVARRLLDVTGATLDLGRFDHEGLREGGCYCARSFYRLGGAARLSGAGVQSFQQDVQTGREQRSSGHEREGHHPLDPDANLCLMRSKKQIGVGSRDVTYTLAYSPFFQ